MKARLPFEQFSVPSYLALDAINRWVILASLIPWDDLAIIFMPAPSALKHCGLGRPSHDLCLVIADLLAQRIEDLTDVRTLQLIQSIGSPPIQDLDEYLGRPYLLTDLIGGRFQPRA